MIVAGKIKTGAYFDSVALMQCGKRLSSMDGIADATVMMATKSNLAILRASGLVIPEFDTARDTDLLIAVKAQNDAAASAALGAVDAILAETRKKIGNSAESQPASLEAALQALPGANLALISVAGRYAGAVAMSALENGLHTMLFSDNVPLETEIKLKQFGRDNHLLVMGPDCGTAIINGVPLGFANAVRRGAIGIVAAAGTGLQEVSCIIANAGGGLSQGIGTGGRDVKKDVGGMMFLEALQLLDDDENTRVILLVSKPPHREVMERINAATKKIAKPVVRMFVGAAGEVDPKTLEEAALMSVDLASGKDPAVVRAMLSARDVQLRDRARRERARRKSRQRYVRGLFSGGTFCAEAQALYGGMLADIFSNAPIGASRPLADSMVSEKHSLIDFGEDEFTVGRLHPMIDYTLRNQRIAKEAADPETAVILLDVVLGYGSNADPAGELCPVVREATKRVAVVCSVTGTDQDPQNRGEVVTRLEEAGAMVMPSNAAACLLAGYIAQELEGRR